MELVDNGIFRKKKACFVFAKFTFHQIRFLPSSIVARRNFQKILANSVIAHLTQRLVKLLQSYYGNVNEP